MSNTDPNSLYQSEDQLAGQSETGAYGEGVVVGVFNDRVAAETAILELERAGFPQKDLGFLIRGTDLYTAEGSSGDGLLDNTSGTAEGIVTGGLIGGALATAVAVLIPPVGPVLVGGLLASFFGGTLAGMAVGGIIGALTDFGLSEDHARLYDHEFRTGKGIVAVKTHSRVGEAVEILSRNGGYLIHTETGSAIDADNRTFPSI